MNRARPSRPHINVLSSEASHNLMYALLGAYRRESDLGRFADHYLDLNIETIDGTNLEDKVHELIQWAESEGRVRALLDAAEEDRNENDLLIAAVRNARATMITPGALAWYSAPSNPFDSCFLKGGRAFIDRKDLRASLQTLHAGDASTLVVTGEPQSGKSYSLRFVVHIADLYGYRVARVNLREMGTEYGPGDLAASIAREMGRSASIKRMPRREAQAARWTGELRRFVTGEILESGATWWIVFDGVDPAIVRSDTLDLIKKLVLEADEWTVPLRVVLLDCVEPLPAEVDPYVEKEVIAPIKDELLGEFFQELGRHRGAEFDGAAIKQAVKDVRRLAPDGPRQLRRLAAAVERVAKDLPG